MNSSSSFTFCIISQVRPHVITPFIILKLNSRRIVLQNLDSIIPLDGDLLLPLRLVLHSGVNACMQMQCIVGQTEVWYCDDD